MQGVEVLGIGNVRRITEDDCMGNPLRKLWLWFCLQVIATALKAAIEHDAKATP
jgi:hypothetical protein